MGIIKSLAKVLGLSLLCLNLAHSYETLTAKEVQKLEAKGVDLKKIDGIYSNRFGAGMKVEVIESTDQPDLFLPSPLVIDIEYSDKDRIFNDYYPFSISRLSLSSNSTKESIRFYSYDDCDYQECINFETTVEFILKRDGTYYMKVMLGGDSWDYEAAGYLPGELALKKLDFKTFKKIYEDLEYEEFTGTEIDEDYVYENGVYFAEELYKNPSDMACKSMFEDYPGVTELYGTDLETAGCYIAAEFFLKKIK